MNRFINTAALSGIEGLMVQVEVDICRGLPGFHLVGLPNAEVRESRDRVLAALRNSGCRIPPGKITVNLAPAGIRKEGASFDLAIAMAVLGAATELNSQGINRRSGQALFLGELSLFGEIRPIRGLLAMAEAAVAAGINQAVVPASQLWEARLVPGIQAVGAATLKEVLGWWVRGQVPAGNQEVLPLEDEDQDSVQDRQKELNNLVKSLSGMPLLRKAMVVSAAGGHNMLMTGPPGTGKTRLAQKMSRLLPPLTPPEALTVTRIQSASGSLTGRGLVRRRPFRAPHHSITRAGLLGGGSGIRPGEVTLAHLGVLFLDEMAEFPPGILEVLREPMEEGWVNLVRATGERRYPARFQLLAAMNPCRCGFLGSGIKPCSCTASERQRYRNKLGGPLLDRFDLFVETATWQGPFLCPKQENILSGGSDHDWRSNPRLEDLDRIRRGWDGQGTAPNMETEMEAKEYLDRMRLPLGLSLRGIHRCLRVATTLARLEGKGRITVSHVQEALEFRRITPEINQQGI